MNFLSQIQDNESWLFEDEAEMPEIEKMDDFFASPLPHFVPDFSKGLEENFTMEKQMQATATLGSTAPHALVEIELQPCDVESSIADNHEEAKSLQEELCASDPHRNAEFISTYSAVVQIQNLSKGDTNNSDDESSEDEEDEEYEATGRRSRVAHRWGKTKDKRLFELLRKYESEGILIMEDFYVTKDPKSKAIFRELTKLSGWKGSKKRLLNRIRMMQQNSAFSVREIKLLKKVLKRDYRNKTIDYERVLFDFPGKSMQQIIEVCRKVLASRRSKGYLRKSKY